MPGYRQSWRDLGMLMSAPERTGRSVLTPRVGTAPEDYWAVLVCGVSQHLVQLHGEPVEVANVKWAKVAMEGIVEQRLVDAEVDGGVRLVGCSSRASVRPRRPLGRRLGLLGVREGRRGIRRICVGCEIEPVLDILVRACIRKGCSWARIVLAFVVMLTSMTWP